MEYSWRPLYAGLPVAQARSKLLPRLPRERVPATVGMPAFTSKTTRLTLVAKHLLESIVHDGSDKTLYSLGIIDVRERLLGGGQFQKLAEWLPPIGYFED